MTGQNLISDSKNTVSPATNRLSASRFGSTFPSADVQSQCAVAYVMGNLE
jgi:hypothetical protein